MTLKLFLLSLGFFIWTPMIAQQSNVYYLSGTGAAHTKTWEFYCSAGMNSNKWTTIEVPSCWEQQGFGAYNYGLDPFKDRLNEEGRYKLKFQAQSNWKGKNIKMVFEGVMTDCEVVLNGTQIGKHQGAFYEFSFDVSNAIKYGQENVLEVKVKKHSDDESINQAERMADYWIFGGIFRPVYLQIDPKEHMGHVAIDARADGSFLAKVSVENLRKANQIEVAIMDFNGNVETTFTDHINRENRETTITGSFKNPKQWSPEFPNRYVAVFKLLDNKGKAIHEISQKIGFRTIEVREADGIYLNGQKIKFKGVGAHTFHPDYGRTSNQELSLETVNLMKDMNLNAVRLTHYPHDKHFINACDSLGLLVLDELSGWNEPNYDTKIGRKLLTEMIKRDVNAPSIILWDNGNEGGWNPELDGDFKELDIQKRSVIHPEGAFDNTITSHYIRYNYLAFDHFEPRKILFPTEFLHGLYDGGGGAGLDDYWEKMWHHPLSAGGFLWVFADESIRRTDTGKLDSDGNHAPDGIVGPYHEKEGSFYTIKEIWSPIHLKKKYITPEFCGDLAVENRFYFTNLNQCSLEYRWVRLSDDGKGKVVEEGSFMGPDIGPQEKGAIKVPLANGWQDTDVLEIEARDSHHRQIYKWSFPVKSAKKYTEGHLKPSFRGDISFNDKTDGYKFGVAGINIVFDKDSGLLKSVRNTKGLIPLNNGPILLGNTIKVEKVEHSQADGVHTITVSYKKDRMQTLWTIKPNGLVYLDIKYRPTEQVSIAGVDFSFPETDISKIKWLGNGPYRVWKNRLKGVGFNIWEKAYNNTITGYSGYGYPEFKGYYSNLYWAEFILKNNQKFKIYTTTDDLFLKLFNPEEPPEPAKTHVEHSKGDISFLNGIPAIGTKFNVPEVLGPQSLPYSFYSTRVTDGYLHINLIFDFNYWDME